MIGRPIATRVGAIIALMGFVTLGCSLPTDDRVTPIDRSEFPDQLTEETTTTTSTTTTTTITIPADPDDSTPTTTNTTVAPVETELITVYYTRGVSDVVQPVEKEKAVNTPVEELIPLLESSAGISDAGLRTWVLGGLIDNIVVDRGTATVSLDSALLDRMSTTSQERAIAQIVLTLTSFETPDAGNIGSVRFEVDGEGFPVFVPGFGGSSEPGEHLAFTDFAGLIAATPTPTTTTTTSPPPTTTATTATTTTTTAPSVETSETAP